MTPEEAGLTRVAGEALKGGDANVNAVALQSVLDGCRARIAMSRC